MERIAYIGIDVHKDTNSAFMFYRDDNGNPAYYEMGTIPAGAEYMLRAIHKAVKNCNLTEYNLLAG